MPTARIITRFPDRAGSLRKTLVNAGYRVEVIPPEQAGKGFADLEYDLDSMPDLAGQAPPVSASLPASAHERSKPQKKRPTRELPLAVQLRCLREAFARHRHQLEQRISASREAASERKRALDAKAAKRAQLREQERAEDQRRREAHLAAKKEAERIAAERAREQAAVALRQQQEREVQRRLEAEAAAQRRQAELAAKREAERITAERAREQAAIALREKEEREAQRRREAKAAAQRREAELAAKREAERLAAEQAAILRQQQQELEAERQRLLRAEMEHRRREQEEALALARAAAESEAHRETEMDSAEAQPFAVEDQVVKPVIVFPQRRRSLRNRWDDFASRVYERVREWRELSPNSEFANTRDYAWRQAVPAAAGLAIAFALGWVLALANSGNEKALRASPAPVATTAPAAVQTAAASTPPIAAPAGARHVKPSPLVRKTNAKVSRRHTRKIDPQEADVVIIRHPPKRQLIARANQKNAVKTISDME